MTNTPEIGYREYVDINDLEPPEKMLGYSVIVFDDIPSTDQNIIKQYFSFGRHRNLDCFYLCQTYSAISKQLLRDNANLIIVFQQDSTNLRHIYNDHGCDRTFSEFLDLCRFSWREPYGMLVIDCD
ncbi:hypothetical protein QE152_g9322 [Popillia japonica]|uniref:Uncharacterized protein n=1 Tax=Popillia japonica TaxID=7064 RepID=A0AAW1LYZ0_POPJA